MTLLILELEHLGLKNWKMNRMEIQIKDSKQLSYQVI